MNIKSVTDLLTANFLVKTYAGDLVIYQKRPVPVDMMKRIAIIHCRAGEILWTIEYSDAHGIMHRDMAQNPEIAILKFIAGHLERATTAFQDDLFAGMMANFKTELTDEEMSPGPAPKRFITRHHKGGETSYAIFEDGNPEPLGIFDCEDEAEKSPLMEL